MAVGGLANLSLTNLRKLTAGMTRRQVEDIVGPYHRPNVYRGRRYYAWIGKGAMLRAWFNGPHKTLSVAVVDWPRAPYQKVLVSI
jgi:hypothetical protein